MDAHIIVFCLSQSWFITSTIQRLTAGWLLLLHRSYIISYILHMYLTHRASCHQVIMGLCKLILPPTQVSGSIHACLQSQQTQSLEFDHHPAQTVINKTFREGTRQRFAKHFDDIRQTSDNRCKYYITRCKERRRVAWKTKRHAGQEACRKADWLLLSVRMMTDKWSCNKKQSMPVGCCSSHSIQTVADWPVRVDFCQG